jgi:dTDP-4-dehydrorhamnose 3,5-epimerase-like enzyme
MRAKPQKQTTNFANLFTMNKQEKITKPQNDVAFWQDKLNRSRKESLRSIRALHLQRCQSELAKLTA